MNKKTLHVIVQAGGRGSRLRHHTWNKPKCLVSVHGKTLLYHLFDRFSTACFTVIGDYGFEQLEKYLHANPPQVKFSLIRATEHGTAAGIADACQNIPADSPLVLVWSDLILSDLLDWPDVQKPVVCTTSAFTCRWSVSVDGHLHESPSANSGVPGLFYFPRVSLVPEWPKSGEFVKWFASNIHDFTLMHCPHLQEVGDFASLEKINAEEGFSRFFNQVKIGEKTVEKKAADTSYECLLKKEKQWYRDAFRLGFRRIPKIISESPFLMEKISGTHLYLIKDLTQREQRAVFADYLDTLLALHETEQSNASVEDVNNVYFKKTVDRVKSIASIVPGFEQEFMTINGKKCRNFFHDKYADFISSIIPDLTPSFFVPIHGDPTFSNTLIDNKLRTWFIDPRGYFSKPGILGDPWYDFAKVYYSAIGGYDCFNRRQFKLHIDRETVEILAETPLYSKIAYEIFFDYFGSDISRIEILHGLIWLSLSGYVRDDVDSIIGAFYLGLYWLEMGAEK